MELRDYLFQNRITCAALSKQIGISGNHLILIKNKRLKPSVNLAREIEIATGGQVTYSELMGEQHAIR